jgi:hypothetical protein
MKSGNPWWIRATCTSFTAIPYQRNLEGYHDDAAQNISSKVSCQATLAKQNRYQQMLDTKSSTPSNNGIEGIYIMHEP